MRLRVRVLAVFLVVAAFLAVDFLAVDFLAGSLGGQPHPDRAGLGLVDVDVGLGPHQVDQLAGAVVA